MPLPIRFIEFKFTYVNRAIISAIVESDKGTPIDEVKREVLSRMPAFIQWCGLLHEMISVKITKLLPVTSETSDYDMYIVHLESNSEVEPLYAVKHPTR